MRFVIVTDVHYGKTAHYRGCLRKMGHCAEKLLTGSVALINERIKPDFVVQLGDLIDDIDKINDRANFQRALQILGSIKAPLYHVVGNHDQFSFERHELREYFGTPELYYSFCKGGYTFAVMDAVAHGYEQYLVPDEQLQWFKQLAEASQHPLIVFIHPTLADQDMSNHWWYEGDERGWLVTNRREVRRVIEESGKVQAVFNGHLHWNRLHVHSDIPYFTIQSLVEDYENAGRPSASLAIVDLTPGKAVQVQVIGNDSAAYSFPHAFGEPQSFVFDSLEAA